MDRFYVVFAIPRAKREILVTGYTPDAGLHALPDANSPIALFETILEAAAACRQPGQFQPVELVIGQAKIHRVGAAAAPVAR